MSALPEPGASTESPGDKPDEERSARRIGGTIFNLVMLVVGGIALYLILRHHGWDEFRGMLDNVGWWFALVLALELGSLCMDAAALHAFMRPEARMISYWRVLGAQASGRAINVLTPGGALGEPTKLMLLSTHAPQSRALSSLVMLGMSLIYAAVLVMVIGIPITLLLMDVPHGVKVMVGIGLAIVIPAIIALTVLIHRGAGSTVVAALHRIRIIGVERERRWREKLVDVDRHIRELASNRSAGTWKGILWVGGSKVLTWTSSITLVAAVGVPISPTLVIGYLSVGVLIGWISQIVPMGLGVQDGGNYALFGLLGATGPQGLLVTMLNRARSVTVAILGLGALAALQIANRLAITRMRRQLRRLKDKAEHPEVPATEPASS